ncbi:M16 family metallopeptidase, partial [Candidatus Auribacterota bacterium]
PVASIEVWVKTGSVTEGRYESSGISHFVEHMLFKGTEKRGVGEISKEIQQYGGEINAHTSYDYTVYSVDIDSSKFLNACEILSDALINSAFDQDEFKKEMDVILKEINMNEDDPRRKIIKTFFNTVYREHPYKNPIIGYQDVFEKLTRYDMLNYFREKYVPNNIVFVAVGDFDRKKAYEELKDLFKDYDRGYDKPVFVPEEPKQLGLRENIGHADINKAYLFMGYHTTDIKDDDKFALDVLSMILGQGRSSRLYKKLREKLQLVNSISSWSFTPIYPTLDVKNYEKVLKEIDIEIERVKKEKVADNELEKVKELIISDYFFSLDTTSGQASDLGFNEVATGNYDYSKDYVSNIQKVTGEDIIRVAGKYFHDENKSVVSLVPRGYSTEAGDVDKAAGKAEETKKITLPNGLTLLVKEDNTLPTLSIRAIMRGGILVEDKKNNGISNLCSQLLLKGTKNRTADEIAEEIESVGGGISSYSANNSFGVSVDILSGKKDIALDILADVLQNPAFNEKDIEKEKKIIMLNIKSLEDQPYQAASKLFKETMFKGHPYQFQSIGTIESIKGISRKDLADFHDKYVVPDNMVVAVYGDIKAKDIETLIKKKFAGLKASGIKFPETKIDFKKGVIKEKKKMHFKQAVVMVGFRCVDIYDPDKYDFEILDAAFSGQGSRLFAAVREEEGLAYAVGSYLIIGLDPGAFVFYVATIPEKVDRVVELILNEVKDLKKAGIGAEELGRIKNGLIGTRKIQLQTNAQLSLQSSIDELYGLGYDNYKEYYDRIGGVSDKKIVDVAKQYFTLDDYVIVVIEPESSETEVGSSKK